MNITPNIVREEVLTLFEKQIGMEPSRMTCHLLRSLTLAICGVWEILIYIAKQIEGSYLRP